MNSRFEVTSAAEALASDEILLKRDVLDTQIVDVVGQRLARVADVLLARTAGGRLEALGVEVGFGVCCGGYSSPAVASVTTWWPGRTCI